MFGDGRAQNVAALVAATLFISFTSFELYREAVARLWTHDTATFQHVPLAIGVLLPSTLTLVQAHDIAKRVDAVMEPVLGDGISEVHVDPRS
jgi:divalent metal cation (Fe/Co/Zn/Cd) transporter